MDNKKQHKRRSRAVTDSTNRIVLRAVPSGTSCMKVAFCGLGPMGRAMVRRLLGAQRCDTPAQAAELRWLVNRPSASKAP